MERDLDLYKITIDEIYSDGKTDLGIEQIAFVKNPAIMVKGMAFNTDKIKNLLFKDDVKMRIAAPALIPMQIYRYDEESDYEYYVEFTAEVIEQLYSKFMKNLSNQDKYNLEHDIKETVPAYVLESILVDSEPKIKMIKDEYNITLPKGSVFIVSQVTDRNYYDNLVKEERFAYSIEGYLGMEFVKTKLAEMININKNKEKTKMKRNKLKKFSGKSRFKAFAKFEDATLSDEMTIVADEIAVDQEVVIITEELEIVPDFTGELVVSVEGEDETIKVEDGVITEVVEESTAEEVVAASEEDKTELETEEDKTELETEEVTTDKPAIDEASVLAIIQPKLDEIYAMIAELKAKTIEETEMEETEIETVQMSVSERLAKFNKFNK